MKKNEIYKIYGKNYMEMTMELLREAELEQRIPDKEVCIGIKPNLVAPTPAEYGATTHPQVVEGLICYLQERGYHNLLMAEGSWVGDRTSEAYEFCGYRALSEKYGVPFVDTQKDGSHEVDCQGMTLRVCDVVDRIDFMINVPVLKGHCQTHITCALKNMKGLIPNSEKRKFHTMGLHKPIAHLTQAIRQDFILVDHICGDLDFEEGGNPVTRDCLMAAVDPVLLDSYVCRMLHYDVEEVPYIRMAEQLGAGSTELSLANIRELNPNPLDGELPMQRRILKVAYAVDEVDSCSACYGNLVPALCRLEEEGLLKDFQGKIAIGQGHRQQTGEIGVGRCTGQYRISIPGCPPEEETIYRELKAYLTKED